MVRLHFEVTRQKELEKLADLRAGMLSVAAKLKSQEQ